MSITLITPLQTSFTRDLKAKDDVFDDANATALTVPDGSWVAIDTSDSDKVGVAINASPTENFEVQIAGTSSGSSARVVFNGTERLDVQDTRNITVLEGSGHVIETDQFVADTYVSGEALTVGATTSVDAGKLKKAAIDGTSKNSTDPVVAIVDKVPTGDATLIVKIV